MHIRRAKFHDPAPVRDGGTAVARHQLLHKSQGDQREHGSEATSTKELSGPTVSENGSPYRRARYNAFDGLRGIAALMIVAFHIRWTNHFVQWPGVRNGFLAVDLFFILSGFVLANTRLGSLEEYKQFLRRRFFRVYPMHFAALAVLVLIELAKAALSFTDVSLAKDAFSSPYDAPSLLPQLFLLQAIAMDRLTWNNPSWSISCEFIAYTLFGLAVVAGLSRWRWLNVSALAAAILLYVAVACAAGTLNVSVGTAVFRCLAGFMLGMCLFRYAHNAAWLSRLSARCLSFIQIGVAAWILAALTFADGVRALAILPGFALALMFLHQDRGMVAEMLQLKAFSFLGLISYSIYMIHFPLLLMVERVIHHVAPGATVASGFIYIAFNPWLGDALFIAAIAAVVAISAITFRWIEEPWRRRGYPRRTDRIAVAAPCDQAAAGLLPDQSPCRAA